jgi:hypothetical protein
MRIEFEEEQKAQINSQQVIRNRSVNNKQKTNNEYYDEEGENDDEYSLLGANKKKHPKKAKAGAESKQKQI